MKAKLTWLVIAACVVGALTFAAWPDSKPQTDAQRIDKLATEIKCPTCAGLSVAESSSPLANSSREEIERRVKEGESNDEIRDYFVSRYGDDALMTPARHGVTLVAWILPVVFGVLAMVAVAYTIRRWSKRTPPDEDPVEFVTTAAPLTGATPSKPLRIRKVWVAGGIAIFILGAGFAVTSASQDKDPKDAPSLLARAQQFSAQGKPFEALKAYDAVLEVDPKNANALAYRGWLIRLAGEPDKGLESIDASIAADPNYPDAHFFRGIILLRDKAKPAEAVLELERFLQTNPPEETRALVEQALNDAKTQAR